MRDRDPVPYLSRGPISPDCFEIPARKAVLLTHVHLQALDHIIAPELRARAIGIDHHHAPRAIPVFPIMKFARRSRMRIATRRPVILPKWVLHDEKTFEQRYDAYRVKENFQRLPRLVNGLEFDLLQRALWKRQDRVIGDDRRNTAAIGHVAEGQPQAHLAVPIELLDFD